MKCPFCGSGSLRVTDKRESDRQTNRRRRECQECNKRFTTYERIEVGDIFVIKKDGKRELFSREKLLKGLLKACEKRPIGDDRIVKVVDQIIAMIANMESEEIRSEVIGNLVMEQLKKLDQIAYIRFASVYREFRDVKEFEQELKNLKSGK